MAEAAHGCRRERMVRGELHAAVEAFLEIGGRFLGGGVLAVENLTADRLVTRRGRRVLHVDRELFLKRQIEETLRPRKLGVDERLRYAVAADIEESDVT